MRILPCLFLLALVGCGSPSFLVTPVANTNQLNEMTVHPAEGWTGDKVVIVPVDGVIMNARTGGFLQPTENPLSLFQQQFDTIAKDPSVKAVVLRINSPGGTVSSADAMYQIVKRYREKTRRPVVASAQEVMASGGYYVACAADRIVAQPTSVVGSIGVIFETLEFADGLAKIGVRSNPIKSAKFKDIGSPFKHLSDDERALMQEMVDEYFHRFQGVVKAARPQVAEKPTIFETTTDGRVFSGQRALELGLVDSVGLLNDAVEEAKRLGGNRDAKVVMYSRPYAYGGSIYASADVPAPQANVTALQLPESVQPLPAGFYYLWRP